MSSGTRRCAPSPSHTSSIDSNSRPPPPARPNSSWPAAVHPGFQPMLAIVCPSARTQATDVDQGDLGLQAARSVNTAHVCANWLIKPQIVQVQQGGAAREAYGQAVLKSSAER